MQRPFASHIFVTLLWNAQRASINSPAKFLIPDRFFLCSKPLGTFDMSELLSPVVVKAQGGDDLAATAKAGIMERLEESEKENLRKDNEIELLNEKFQRIKNGLLKIDEERESLRQSKKAMEGETSELRRQLDMREKEVISLVRRCTLQEDRVKETAQLQAENSGLNEQVEKLRKSLYATVSDSPNVEKLKRELKQCHKEREDMKSRLAALKRDNDNVTETLTSYFHKMEAMNNQLQELEDVKQEGEKMQLDLEKQRLSHLRDANEFRAALQQKQQQLEHMERTLRGNNQSLAKIRKDKVEFKNKLESELSMQRDKHEVTVASLAKQHQVDLERAQNAYEEALKDLRVESSKKADTISSLEDELARCMDELMISASDLERLQEESNDAINSNQERVEALSVAHEALRQQLEASERNSLVLSATVARLNAVKVELEQEVETLQTRASELEADNAFLMDLEDQFKEISQALSDVNQEHIRTEGENQVALEELQKEFQSQLEMWQSMERGLLDHVTCLEVDKQRLESELEKEVVKSNATEREWQERLDTWSAEQSALHATIEHLGNEIEMRDRSLFELHEQLEVEKNRALASNDELERLSSALSELESSVSEDEARRDQEIRHLTSLNVEATRSLDEERQQLSMSRDHVKLLQEQQLSDSLKHTEHVDNLTHQLAAKVRECDSLSHQIAEERETRERVAAELDDFKLSHADLRSTIASLEAELSSQQEETHKRDDRAKDMQRELSYLREEADRANHLVADLESLKTQLINLQDEFNASRHELLSDILDDENIRLGQSSKTGETIATTADEHLRQLTEEMRREHGDLVLAACHVKSVRKERDFLAGEVERLSLEVESKADEVHNIKAAFISTKTELVENTENFEKKFAEIASREQQETRRLLVNNVELEKQLERLKDEICRAKQENEATINAMAQTERVKRLNLEKELEAQEAASAAKHSELQCNLVDISLLLQDSREENRRIQSAFDHDREALQAEKDELERTASMHLSKLHELQERWDDERMEFAAQLASTEGELQQKLADIATLESKVSEQLESSQAKEGSFRRQIEQQDERIAAMRTELENVKREQDVARESTQVKLAALECSVQSKSVELAIAQDEIRDLRFVDLKEAEESIQLLEEELESVRQIRKAEETTYNARKSELEHQLAEKSAFVDRVRTEETHVRERALAKATSELDSMKEENAYINEELKAQYSKLEARNDLIRDLTNKNQTLEESKRSLGNELESLRRECENVRERERKSLLALDREIQRRRLSQDDDEFVFKQEQMRLQTDLAEAEAKVARQAENIANIQETLDERSTLLSQMVAHNRELQEENESTTSRLRMLESTSESRERDRDFAVQELNRLKTHVKTMEKHYQESMDNEQNLREIAETEVETLRIQLMTIKRHDKDSVELEKENGALRDKIRRQEAFLKRKLKKEKTLRTRNTNQKSNKSVLSTPNGKANSARKTRIPSFPTTLSTSSVVSDLSSMPDEWDSQSLYSSNY